MTVRWVRSMPDPIPPHRAYVHDELQKFYHTDYDYTKLVPWNDDCRLNLLEWDVAIGLETVESWTYRHDNRVWVGRCAHYDTDPPHYVQRYFDYRGKLVWGASLDGITCDYSGFDLISFPQGYLRQCCDWIQTLPVTVDHRLTDNTFSCWMHEVRHEPFYIDGSAILTHLHYPMPNGVETLDT